MNRHPRTARLALFCCAAVLAACAKTDKSVADTAATPIDPGATTGTSAGAVAGTASLALSDVAGTWKMRAVPTSGSDMTPTEYTLVATGEPGGWKATFANGLVVPVRVSAAGDSIAFEMGPYKSVRRKGVDVTTRGVFRKQGDKLAGNTSAHYNVKTADSLLTLRVEGTKAP